jgi:hypothetical protein
LQFIILTFIYSSTCFGRFPAHHQELNDCSGSLWFYLRIVVTVVLCSWSGRLAPMMIQHESKQAAISNDIFLEIELCLMRFIFILHQHCTQLDDSE